MKTLHISIIVITIVIAAFFLYSFYLSDRNRESCYTRMIVIYAEPAKYNQTIILNALKGNLSGDNFGDLHGSNLWWQGVDVSTTNKHVVNLLIPSVDAKTINMTKTIVSKIDGVGKILSSYTECIHEQ